MVFYRKYRPQKISELDSAEVREALLSVLSRPMEDVPHAFLFTGPKGLGKTSTARIVAKAVNCEKVPQGDKRKVNSLAPLEPCNTCNQCVSITNGTNMDVIEMDAASNRGIDEVRELKETITLAPLSAQRKVYIIDEVHMLTTEAFNALLKTLEEPPAHAMFILCTTELHKVPVTILSRCVHIPFHLATTEELVRSFKRIVEAEKIAIEADALELVASLSDGGFRDGAKMLEEIASRVKEGPITASFITDYYHLSGSAEVIADIITSLVKKDAKQGMTALQAAVKKGIDIKYIMETLLNRLHATLLAASGVEAEKDTQLSRLSISELVRLSELLTRAYQEMKYAVIAQLPLEIVLLEWSASGGESEQQKTEPAKGIMAETVSVSTLRRHVGNMAKQKALTGEKKDEALKKVPPATSGVSILHFTADGEITKEWLGEFWSCLLDRLKTDHHTIAGVLRGCVIKNFDRKTLTIQTAYKFHKERLDEAKNREILETMCKELTGNPIAVTIELVNK